MVAPVTVEAVVGILVGLGVLLGMMWKTIPILSQFYHLPERLGSIEESQAEMCKQLEGQHETLNNHVTDLEGHIADAQAGIIAVAKKTQNDELEIDVEKMDSDYLRGSARARDYVTDGAGQRSEQKP